MVLELFDEDVETLSAVLGLADDLASVDVAGDHQFLVDSGAEALSLAGFAVATPTSTPATHDEVFDFTFHSPVRNDSPGSHVDIAERVSVAVESVGSDLTVSVQKHIDDAVPDVAPGSSSAPKPKRRRTGRRNSNRARDEERQELLRLREAMNELTCRLAVLKETERSGVVQHQIDVGNSDERAFRIWRESAKRQMDQRLKSEAERRRLRLLLEGQVKVVRALQQLIHSQATAQAMNYCGLGRHSPWLRDAESKEPSAEIFRRLAGEVQATYLRVDNLFGAQPTDTHGEQVQLCADEAGALSAQVFAYKIFPFDAEATRASVWQHVRFETRPFACRTHLQQAYQVLSICPDSENAVVERFMMELTVQKTTACFDVHQVVQQFPESDRTVIVWHSRVDPIAFDGQALPRGSAHLDEGSCIVIERAHGMTTSFASMRTCHAFNVGRPPAEGSRYRPDPQFRSVCDFVLRCKALSTSVTHEVIENLLFDRFGARS